MKALIVVDVQNGFMEKELPAPRAKEIIAPINQLMKKFEMVVATQDWHPSNHLSFASQHPGKKPFEEGILGGKPHTLWPDHCVMGTWGADFAEGLDLRPIQAIFRKGTHREADSYSGFMDDNRQFQTGLTGFLKEHGVKEIHLAGLALDYCVKATALDAAKLGFSVVIHADACRAVAEESGQKAIEEMKKKGISVV